MKPRKSLKLLEQNILRTEHIQRLHNELTSKGGTLSFLIDNSLKMANSIWSNVHACLVTYLISLATRKNLARWNLSQTPDCSFCPRTESLQHIVTGCKNLPQFSLVKFVNLSVSCLGIFGRAAGSFIDMCKDLNLDQNHLRFIIKKTSNITRSTYFIFCR